MKTIVFIACFFLYSSLMLGQTSNTCDSILVRPDTLAKFKDGTKALSDFAYSTIVPILGSCNPYDKSQLSSLRTVFTIDDKGSVMDVEFKKQNLPVDCKNKLKLAFIAMDKWKPAVYKGATVCSYYYFPIACIKWQ